MIFDDLEINNLVKDNELYVCVSDLSNHLLKAVKEFSEETQQISHFVRITEHEKAFITGLVNGMYNVVLMLTQSEDEYKLKQINTIDELLEKFSELNES